MEIRWDTGRMVALATMMDDYGTELMARRADVVDSCHRAGGRVIDLSAMVISSRWAKDSAADLMVRQRLLSEAEARLLWDLTPPPPDERSRPPLRSRAIDRIERELDTALGVLGTTPGGDQDRGTAELRVLELTYELALARRNLALLDSRLPETSSSLSDLIDFLGYEIALMQPEPRLDWQRVAVATAEVRGLLDESWFGDVGRDDLLAIHTILASLPGPELDAVIGSLSDDEMYRWFHEFDGIRGGNLSEGEEAALFATLARTASAATLFRLAGGERGSRFMQIASAVQQSGRPAVAMEFIEACAAHAAASDDALLGALAGLAALDRRHRNVVVASLHLQGLLDPLSPAIDSFVQRQTVERDDPIVIEFFEGIGAAIGNTVTTLADLTVVGLIDRDRFRETWSQVGGLAGLVFTDPEEFVAIVLDLETLRRNPAQWIGSAVGGLVTAGVGRFARLGRLGKLPRSAADWFKRMADTPLITRRRFELQVGHVTPIIDHVGAALDAAAVSEAMEELALVDGYLEELSAYCPATPGTG